MLGRNEFALRQGFGLWPKRLCGANARRPGGRFGSSPAAVSIIENIDFNRPLQKAGHLYRCPFFYAMLKDLIGLTFCQIYKNNHTFWVWLFLRNIPYQITTQRKRL